MPRRAGEELESFLLGSLLPVSGELTTGIPTFAPALSLKAGVAALALSLLCCGFGTSSAGSNGLASSLPSSVTFCYCREGGRMIGESASSFSSVSFILESSLDLLDIDLARSAESLL